MKLKSVKYDIWHIPFGNILDNISRYTYHNIDTQMHGVWIARACVLPAWIKLMKRDRIKSTESRLSRSS